MAQGEFTKEEAKATEEAFTAGLRRLAQAKAASLRGSRQ